MFITVFAAILNIRTGKLTFTNAGHNPPYIIRKDGSILRLAHRHGTVIGALPGMKYSEETIQMNRDDYLLLYTDGVTEAMNLEKKLFSENRLARLLESERFTSVKSLVDAVMASVNKFSGEAPQSDDITVLAMRYINNPEEAVNNEGGS